MKKLGYGIALVLAAAVLFLLPAAATAAVGDDFIVQCDNTQGTESVDVTFKVTKEDAGGNEVSVGTGANDARAVDENTTTSVVIPETVTYNGKDYSVTSIAAYAFGSCQNLEYIRYPSSLKTIGEGAFWGCANLRLRTIPDNIALGDYAFTACRNWLMIEVMPRALGTA